MVWPLLAAGAVTRGQTEMKRRRFAVIGLGTFGSTVASELARFGNPVLGIDNQERMLSHLSSPNLPNARGLRPPT